MSPEDSADNNEFIEIHDANKSSEIYRYWNFEKFNSKFNSSSGLDRLLNKNNIFSLNECLELHGNIFSCQRSKCESLETLCIFY